MLRCRKDDRIELGLWEIRSSVGVATGPAGTRAVAMPPTASRPALGSTQPQFIGNRGLFPSGLKHPGREVECQHHLVVHGCTSPVRHAASD